MNDNWATWYERAVGGAPAAASSNERQGVAMTGGYFELRSDEETNRRYWWGSEDGWKGATEIGQDGVLTLDAGAFAVGTTLRLYEPDGVAMTEAERLNALKRAAWNTGDLDLYDFYSRLGCELGRLRIVGKMVVSIYQKAGYSDDNWQALFEALSDAGLLDDGSEDRLGRE